MVNPLGIHFSRIKVSDLLLVNAKGETVIGDQPREGERIAQALGDRKGAILKNHDILTAGPTVEAAAWWYIALDNACHTQLLTEAAGKPQPIDEATARHTHSQIGKPEGAIHAFDSLYQGLLAAEPELLD